MSTPLATPAPTRHRPRAARPARTSRAAPVAVPLTPTATVVHGDGDSGGGGRLELRDDAGVHRPARRAASCLLVPAPGDTVACIHTAQGDCWVLAVLARGAAGTAAPVLRCEPGTRLRAEGGLGIEAAQLRLAGEQLELSARRATLAVDDAELVGQRLRVVGHTLRLAGTVLSTVMERVTHFSRAYLRTTQGTDKVMATQLECEAEQLLRLQAEHAIVQGTQLVKARGAQIHFG